MKQTAQCDLLVRFNPRAGVLANNFQRHQTVRINARRMLDQSGRKNGTTPKPKFCSKERERPEPTEAPRILLKPALSAQADLSLNSAQDDLTRKAPVWLVPRIDQRFHGVPQAEVQKDQSRKHLIGSLTRLVLNHPEKVKLMDDAFKNNDDAHRPMSANAKETLKHIRPLWALTKGSMPALFEVRVRRTRVLRLKESICTGIQQS